MSIKYEIRFLKAVLWVIVIWCLAGIAWLSSRAEGQEIKLISPGLINEPGQANLGSNPHKLGIPDGSPISPVTDLQPTISFQRWISTLPYSTSSTSTTIPYQFYCNHLYGPGYVYCGDFWVRSNSRLVNDITGVSGRVYMEPFGLITGVSLTGSSTGGSLSAGNVAYYVSAIIDGEEILGSQHYIASLSGSTSSVTVSWSNLSGASSYRVYRYYPDLPLIYPVWFEVASSSSSSSSSTSFVDTGMGGTPGIGLASTGWGGWFQAWKTSHSARIAGIEIDAINNSGMDAPYRPDVVGSSIGAQIVSAGTNKNSIGVHLVGSPNAPFKRGILLDAGSFSDLGLDIESADNSNTIALIRNSSSNPNSIAIWRAQSDVANVSLLAHSSARTVSRHGVTLGGYSELLSTTGNGLLIGTSTSTPIILGTGSTGRVSIGATGKVTFSTPEVLQPKAITIPSDGTSSFATYSLSPSDSSLYTLSCVDPHTCKVSLSEASISSGQRLDIIVLPGSTDIVIEDVSGVSETSGNWTGLENDSISFVYISDRWIEVGRSNN